MKKQTIRMCIAKEGKNSVSKYPWWEQRDSSQPHGIGGDQIEKSRIVVGRVISNWIVRE